MYEKDWQGTDTSYWDERASKEYTYRKEKFYTITPVPYYYARRKLVIKKIEKIIEENNFKNICDFGCGDGEYIKKIRKKELYLHGVDASSAMIEIAREQACYDNVSFEISANGITEDIMFDMVYSSAVWAHIDDKNCQCLMKNIYEHLHNKGIFVICEQTAPYKYGGGYFLRRTCEAYYHYLKSAGFTVLSIEVIDFWLHRLLVEKRLVKWLCKRRKYSAYTSEQIRIELNRSKIYRMISSVFTKLSIPRVFRGLYKGKKIRNRWGYCFCIALKE